VLLEIAIVFALTVVNGLLAMSELAVVSARRTKLKSLAERGSRGAASALRLAEDPGRFLSAVQIGITLVGVLSGAFSGATLGARLAGWLATQGLAPATAQALGFGGVVVAITYLSLIIGELVPKRIALRDPEAVAVRVAPAMSTLALLAAPLVALLDLSGRAILTLLGLEDRPGEGVTEEEVRSVVAEASASGVIETEEMEMISGVMRLGDRAARALMTPRRDVEVLDLSAGEDAILERLRNTRRARLPVRDGAADDIVGVIVVREALADLDLRGSLELQGLIRTAPVVLDGADALSVIRSIRASTVHMALVFDEYGHFEGVITSGDILEAIVGVLREEGEEDEPAMVERESGGLLVAGWMPIDEFADRTGAPVGRGGEYETVAGYVLTELGRLPAVGERFEREGWTFEVVDLDGRRIDKLLVTAPAAAA
jgi:putative hemolysin